MHRRSTEDILLAAERQIAATDDRMSLAYISEALTTELMRRSHAALAVSRKLLMEAGKVGGSQS